LMSSVRPAALRALAETRALTGERGAYRLAGPVHSLQLPATAQSILAARIDHLAPGDKRLLQAAAVIGKDVPFLLLEAIAEEPEERLREGLARLQAAEFVYEARLFPELEYTFKHALTHEVTYGGMLQDRRSALHARILEAMERLPADHLGEQVERLAHHAVRGAVRDKAVTYLCHAGRKAAARSALQDARAWFEQTLSILKTLTESPSTLEQAFEIRLELRPVLTQLGEVRRALERLREAEALAERLNDDRRQGRVCAFMTNIHSLLGELDEAAHQGPAPWRSHGGRETWSFVSPPRPIWSKRITCGASTSRSSSWRPTISPCCPRIGSPNMSEALRRHRSTTATGWP
jgi:predicted ATPase